jgi:hypothetical protein
MFPAEGEIYVPFHLATKTLSQDEFARVKKATAS